MATGDKIFVTLLALFIAGLVGGALGSLQWLWLCAPFVLVVALVALAFWLANRQLKGWKIL